MFIYLHYGFTYTRKECCLRSCRSAVAAPVPMQREDDPGPSGPSTGEHKCMRLGHCKQAAYTAVRQVTSRIRTSAQGISLSLYIVPP